MKLTSIFCLGLGMTAAMASSDSYLRVNGSSRKLSHSAMQRALGHFPSPPSSSTGSSDGGGDEDEGDDDCQCENFREDNYCGCLQCGGGCAYEEPVETKKSWLSWFGGSSTSSSSTASGGADGADNGEDGIQEQYFANEYNSGGAGSAQNASGSSAANVWPFLAAALVVGVVAAALVTLKKVSLALCLYFPNFAIMSLLCVAHKCRYCIFFHT